MKRGSLGDVSKRWPVCEVAVNTPKLARNPQILTAAHQRIALARLGRSGDARRVEVLLLATSDTDKPGTWIPGLARRQGDRKSANEPSEADESVLSAHDLGTDVGLTPWCKTPCARPERLVQYSSVLDFRQVQKTV